MHEATKGTSKEKSIMPFLLYLWLWKNVSQEEISEVKSVADIIQFLT